MRTTKNDCVKNHNHQFNKLMLSTINNFSGDSYYERLEIYNYISRVLNNINDEKIYHELLYRLEEGENLNTIILDLMDDYNIMFEHLDSVKLYLLDFEYFDEFYKFFK